MADDIQVVESPRQMAIGEAIAWTFDFSGIGTPSSITSFLAYDELMVDKSGLVLSGAASIVGDTVVGKVLTPAVAQEYTLQCKVAIGGNSIISTLLVEVYNPVALITLSNGYATVKELKHYLAPGAAADKYDDEIMAHCIDTASRFIEAQTRRTFYSRTMTRLFNVPYTRTLVLDDDLLSITTLTNGDGVVIVVTDYSLWPTNSIPKSEIILKKNHNIWWDTAADGDNEAVISVAGSWGYSTITPVDVKQAVLDMASTIYKRRFGENANASTKITGAGIVILPQDMSSFTQRIIDYYRRIV